MVSDDDEHLRTKCFLNSVLVEKMQISADNLFSINFSYFYEFVGGLARYAIVLFQLTKIWHVIFKIEKKYHKNNLKYNINIEKLSEPLWT